MERMGLLKTNQNLIRALCTICAFSPLFLSSCINNGSTLGTGGIKNSKKTAQKVETPKNNSFKATSFEASPIATVHFRDPDLQAGVHGFVANMSDGIAKNLAAASGVNDLFEQVLQSETLQAQEIEVRIPHYGVKFKIPLKEFFPITNDGDLGTAKDMAPFMKNLLVYWPASDKNPNGRIQLIYSSLDVKTSNYAFESNDGAINLLGIYTGSGPSLSSSLLYISGESNIQEVFIQTSALKSTSGMPDVIPNPPPAIYSNYSLRFPTTDQNSMFNLPLVIKRGGSENDSFMYFLSPKGSLNFCLDPVPQNNTNSCYYTRDAVAAVTGIPASTTPPVPAILPVKEVLPIIAPQSLVAGLSSLFLPSCAPTTLTQAITEVIPDSGKIRVLEIGGTW